MSEQSEVGDHHVVAVLKESRDDPRTSKRRRRDLERIISDIETLHITRGKAQIRLNAGWHPQPLSDFESERM